MKTKNFNHLTQYFLISTLILFTCFACELDPPVERLWEWRAENYHFPYEINEPLSTAELDNDLDEISGLSCTSDTTTFLGINDEKANVYWLDEAGAIKKKFDFGKDGDYEGVEWVDTSIYVVKSNGRVYEISQWDTEKPTVQEFNNPLKGDNNVEGLAYDYLTGNLLLACKGDPGEDAPKMSRAIYAFDRTTKTLSEQPVFLISLQQFEDYAKVLTDSSLTKKVMKILDPQAEDLNFSPSAIAVHPTTGNLYITSSVGNTIIVLNRAQEILYIGKLNKKVHRQPEGICFLPDGTMLLSNEADGKDPVIHRFAFRP